MAKTTYNIELLKPVTWTITLAIPTPYKFSIIHTTYPVYRDWCYNSVTVWSAPHMADLLSVVAGYHNDECACALPRHNSCRSAPTWTTSTNFHLPLQMKLMLSKITCKYNIAHHVYWGGTVYHEIDYSSNITMHFIWSLRDLDMESHII